MLITEATMALVRREIPAVPPADPALICRGVVWVRFASRYYENLKLQKPISPIGEMDRGFESHRLREHLRGLLQAQDLQAFYSKTKAAVPQAGLARPACPEIVEDPALFALYLREERFYLSEQSSFWATCSLDSHEKQEELNKAIGFAS